MQTNSIEMSPTCVRLCNFKDLGNAIREGNLEFIRNLTKSKEALNSFCRMISQRAIAFDISLRRNSSRKPERKSFHRLLSQKLEPKQNENDDTNSIIQ